MNLAPPTIAFDTVSQPACLAYLIPSRKGSLSYAAIPNTLWYFVLELVTTLLFTTSAPFAN